MTRRRGVHPYGGLAWRLLASRLGSRRPFKLTVAVTDRCDCRCRGCSIWKKPKGVELGPDDRVGKTPFINLLGPDGNLDRMACAIEMI